MASTESYTVCGYGMRTVKHVQVHGRIHAHMPKHAYIHKHLSHTSGTPGTRPAVEHSAPLGTRMPATGAEWPAGR